jgi:hypothetical protein
MTASRSSRRKKRRLIVYIERGCFSCEHALELAARAAHTFPELEVEVFDVGSGRALPASVVAVPTFTLDGGVISLGTPEWVKLTHAITTPTGARKRTS